jgi:hypothetical protein
MAQQVIYYETLFIYFVRGLYFPNEGSTFSKKIEQVPELISFSVSVQTVSYTAK